MPAGTARGASGLGRGASALLALALCACAMGGRGRAERCAGYVPGLGEIMSATQMRHLKLWYAGQARNWPLAAYEIDELDEGFADVVRFHPVREGSARPLSELIPELTAQPIAALRQAVSSRNPRSFASAYDALTEGCNACHVAAGVPFNVVTRPSANPYSNQRFEPPR
jgi:hypothetical protein